jgi:hypothetical protein
MLVSKLVVWADCNTSGMVGEKMSMEVKIKLAFKQGETVWLTHEDRMTLNEGDDLEISIPFRRDGMLDIDFIDGVGELME